MTLRQLFEGDDAVSPVIGVILMVAITVILAAVTATFALGLGQEDSEAPPQASFEFKDGNNANEILIEHVGGDSIDADNLYLGGDVDIPDPCGGGDVTAGNSYTVTSVPSGAELQLVWKSPDSDTTHVLAEGEAP